MKTFSIILSVLFTCLSITAQDRNNQDEVIKVDALMSSANSVPNEVLVKFKNAQAPVLRKSSSNKVISGVSTIDGILGQYDLQEVEQLLPNDNPNRTLRSTKAYSGETIRETPLNQLYRLKVNAASVKTAAQLISELKALPEVEFAEPNYIVSALGQPTGNPGQQPVKSTTQTTAEPTDPMYFLQWGLPAVNLPALWQKPVTRSTRPVIAIIDTGVDTEHPDLAANLWTNPGEAGKTAGYDDDGNGFKDDIHGWDFVNQTANVRDFNSHGTHCAGIAAAVSNNGVGIVGANPNALIMAVAVMQSNGQGDVATIIKGINYAANNGADIISMSFGTYGYSIALEQALAQAYQNCILVAAAGNDGMAIELPKRDITDPMAPMYPGAFTFVLGVQATQQTVSDITGDHTCSWSNYDLNGPVYSGFSEEKLYNYELSAPGATIISTIPGGQYRNYNGTSMACPLVAGGISALLDRKTFASQEMLWSTLIQSANENVNFDAAYTYVPQPQLNIVAIELNDTTAGDGDMRPDAGELLKIYPTLKNTGGEVDDIHFALTFTPLEDNTTVTILDNSAEFGYSLSPYSKMKAENPVNIQIASNVVDGRNIKMQLTAWYGNHQGEVTQDFILNVENGIELSGMLTHDMTLYPENHYIVTDNFAIPAGVHLTIKPGTIIKVKPDATISSAGGIYAVGKPDSMITITKTDLDNYGGTLNCGNGDTLKYCRMEYNSILVYDKTVNMSNCIIANTGLEYFYWNRTVIEYTNIVDNSFPGPMHNVYKDTNSKYNNIINNISRDNNHMGFCRSRVGFLPYANVYSNFGKNGDTKYSVYNDFTSPSILTTDYPCYWGSAKESIAREGIFDFYTPGSGVFGVIDLSNMATRPYAEAHGIVWKVVVNGYDAQDEFETLPPLGVGTHEFKVYFNRAMDKSVTPFIAMGVRPPYTQNAIAENGSWNAAGDIYTAYYTVKAAGTTDGLNRIYVANAKDDEHFEIPYENQRFNVLVQAAGSMSNGFEATPGLGKIDLEWEKPEGYFDDLLGYNMYRYTYLNEGISSDTVLISSSVLADELFTDFDVVPGKTYNYMYKVLRTDLSENNYSKVVSAIPLTATKGDANGSFTVDVADVVATVGHITGQQPQPFIFEAADVNSDGQVNVLDIVGIVNLILNPQAASAFRVNSSAIYSIENGKLYVDSPIALGGVQFKFRGNKDQIIQTMEALNGFEQASQWLDDNTYLLLAYSLSGKEIAAGKTALLQLGEGVVLEDIVLSDTQGANIIAVSNASTNIVKTEGNQVLKVFPNPFSTILTIPVTISNQVNAKIDIVFSDISGREIDRISSVQSAGTYHYPWSPKTRLQSGFYLCQLRINDRPIQTAKVIYLPK